MNERLYQDEDAIGNLYYNNGYVFYNLDPIEINIDGDSIDLEMRIREGRQPPSTTFASQATTAFMKTSFAANFEPSPATSSRWKASSVRCRIWPK